FDALFHPEGHATFGRLISRGVWRLIRRTGPQHRLFPLGGPVALVAVIATWAALLVVGWALIFWPHMPSGFRFQPGVESSGSDFVHSLNLSLVTLTTLGFGDITPTAAALRLILPLEALLGFGLLTASISWLLLIYPVLSRRRSLAYEISLLRAAESEADLSVDRLEPEAVERVLAELTSRLVAVERDLVNFPISYYFAEADARFSLPAAAPYLLELGRRGIAGDEPARVRLSAHLLLSAVNDLGRTAAGFHGGDTTDAEAMLQAYARDHLRET
ncbi:MAG TPA: potassium channel family protein, partial [Solirubrobacteraceae bacterium]